MLAAAEVIRIGALQTRIQAVNGELNILAGQMTNAGLGSQAQHATSIIRPQGVPPPSVSYCANAGLALPASRPALSFPSLRGQWPRGTQLRVSIRTAGVKGQAAGPGVAAIAITNAFTTWQRAAHDVALDFFTFQTPAVDLLVDADIFVFFAAESEIPGIGSFKAAGFAPGERLAGRVILNSANQWTAAELEQVTLDEIGHILGFSDSHTTLSHLVVADPKAPQIGLSTMHPASTNLVLDSETLSALPTAGRRKLSWPIVVPRAAPISVPVRRRQWSGKNLAAEKSGCRISRDFTLTPNRGHHSSGCTCSGSRRIGLRWHPSPIRVSE